MANGSSEHQVYLTDGSFDFSGGVDSSVVPTVRSDLTPNGLRRNQLAWLTNGSVRGGGIIQRTGWIPNGLLHDSTGLFQGGFMYVPTDNSLPYLICSISGHILKYTIDTAIVTDLSAVFGLTNPADVDQAFFVQGEEFLVIQAGDLVTLPLFWDGTTLSRSTGNQTVLNITNVNFTVPAQYQFVDVTLTAPFAGTVNEIVTINGHKYMEVFEDNFLTIKNTETAPGSLIPAGADLFDTIGGTVQTTTLLPFTAPAVGASVKIWVTPLYPLAAPGTSVYIFEQKWDVLTKSHTAPAANHVFLVNIDDVPGSIVKKPADVLSIGELPAATCMDYYMDRIWYAQGDQYSAGDIVGNSSSGSVAYSFRDSILKVTENPLAIGGDGFKVNGPGNIRAIKHSANINTQLGQGQLYISTRKVISSLNVPVTRNDWIAADSNNKPLQTVAQQDNGWVGDRSVVSVNGDLFGQSLEPGIRSLNVAVKNFGQWGNRPLSNNVERAFAVNDRNLMRFSTGIYFDNRLWQGILPKSMPQGVVHQGVLPLDFEIISSFDASQNPAWEGLYTGALIFQMFVGDFGGRERAFGVTLSRVDSSINVVEFTVDQQRDGTDSRVEWDFETPAWTWGSEFTLKQLSGGELWVSRVAGTVFIKVFYRVDSDPCWRFWGEREICAARCEEDPAQTPCPAYPSLEPTFSEGYKWTVVLPDPKAACDSMGVRPTTLGYQFQIRVEVKGWCQIRGMLFYATPKSKAIYSGVSC